MPMPSLNKAKSFLRKSASEVAAWARELNLDEEAVAVIEREVSHISSNTESNVLFSVSTAPHYGTCRHRRCAPWIQLYA